jgi:hypothetical protein
MAQMGRSQARRGDCLSPVCATIQYRCAQAADCPGPRRFVHSQANLAIATGISDMSPRLSLEIREAHVAVAPAFGPVRPPAESFKFAYAPGLELQHALTEARALSGGFMVGRWNLHVPPHGRSAGSLARHRELALCGVHRSTWVFLPTYLAIPPFFTLIVLSDALPS